MCARGAVVSFPDLRLAFQARIPLGHATSSVLETSGAVVVVFSRNQLFPEISTHLEFSGKVN